MLRSAILFSFLWIVFTDSSNVESNDNSRDEGAQQFCAGETFEARCPGNDVIVVLGARYGRMRVGRCVEVEPGFEAMMADPRYLGCSADVSSVISRQCAGRSDCSVRINDQNFDNVKPCYASLKMYLEATVACIKVAADSRDCTVSVSTEAQHIVGKSRLQSSTVGSHCGDKSQPWTVDALAGQRIVVSLLDFNAAQATTINETADANNKDGFSAAGISCRPVYGLVIDRTARKNISLCGQTQNRGDVDEHGQRGTQLRHVYTSASNTLQISLIDELDVVDSAKQNQLANAVVHLSALGCSDLAPPSDDAWLKRDVDEIVVGCYTSRQTWRLRCVDGRWRGTVGQCTEYTQQQISDEDLIASNHLTAAVNTESMIATLSIVAVSCAGVAVCCIIICIGVACLNRQKKLHKSITTDNRDALGDDAVNNDVTIDERRVMSQNCTQYQQPLL